MLWMLRLMKRKRNGLFYSKKEETINSISHGIGIAMGVIVSTLFLIKCYQAQNLWAACGVWPVSYTHLDVYKRQIQVIAPYKTTLNEKRGIERQIMTRADDIWRCS